MSKQGRDKRPNVRPITKIELSEKHKKLRLILTVILLSIGSVAIGMGLFSVLNTQPGWQEIDVASDKPNCSTEFRLLYDFSDAGSNATGVNKSLIALYTEATEDAHALFSADMLEEGLHNVAWLNAHPNEPVTVEAALYQAFSLMKQYENRSVFLAPVFVEYGRVFRSESDVEAASFDPGKNPGVMKEITEMMTYIRDPEMVDVELLGDNMLRLKVSEAYLSYARENEIEALLDFGWMRNAFLADYIAQALMQEGFTKGYLASFDGFTRNLDTRGEIYSVNLFDRREAVVYLPAQMQYKAPLSMVFLHNYPMDEMDRWSCYAYESGETVSSQISPETGRNNTALNNLFAYSGETGCAEVLLQILPCFLAEEFTSAQVNSLTAGKTYAVWFADSVMYYNDPALRAEMKPDTNGAVYGKILSE